MGNWSFYPPSSIRYVSKNFLTRTMGCYLCMSTRFSKERKWWPICPANNLSLSVASYELTSVERLRSIDTRWFVLPGLLVTSQDWFLMPFHCHKTQLLKNNWHQTEKINIKNCLNKYDLSFFWPSTLRT
jgi:hypothetical protein